MKKVGGYISAAEAAARLGYNTQYFTRLLREGKVERATYWHGYLLPEDITEADLLMQNRGRPGGYKQKKEGE